MPSMPCMPCLCSSSFGASAAKPARGVTSREAGILAAAPGDERTHRCAAGGIPPPHESAGELETPVSRREERTRPGPARNTGAARRDRGEIDGECCRAKCGERASRCDPPTGERKGRKRRVGQRQAVVGVQTARHDHRGNQGKCYPAIAMRQGHRHTGSPEVRQSGPWEKGGRRSPGGRHTLRRPPRQPRLIQSGLRTRGVRPALARGLGAAIAFPRRALRAIAVAWDPPPPAYRCGGSFGIGRAPAPTSRFTGRPRGNTRTADT
jgi:hypothetical protein